MQTYIFDLDGCISNHHWRERWLPANPTRCEDWDHYHRRLSNDLPLNGGAFSRAMEEVQASKEKCLFIVTARPRRFESETRKWLLREFGIQPIGCGKLSFNSRTYLLMRPDGDMRSSPELKIALIEERWSSMRGAQIVALHSSDLWPLVPAAYDDRTDILDAYWARGVRPENLFHASVDGISNRFHQQPLAGGFHTTATKEGSHRSADLTAADVLREMADTFESRNTNYKDNWKAIPALIDALYPDSDLSRLVRHPTWHLLELILVKLARFARSDNTHEDSIHDVGVYAAMIESILRSEK